MARFAGSNQRGGERSEALLGGGGGGGRSGKGFTPGAIDPGFMAETIRKAKEGVNLGNDWAHRLTMLGLAYGAGGALGLWGPQVGAGNTGLIGSESIAEIPASAYAPVSPSSTSFGGVGPFATPTSAPALGDTLGALGEFGVNTTAPLGDLPAVLGEGAFTSGQPVQLSSWLDKLKAFGDSSGLIDKGKGLLTDTATNSLVGGYQSTDQSAHNAAVQAELAKRLALMSRPPLGSGGVGY